MTTSRIPNGTTVTVTHDLGTERGEILGSTAGGDYQRYTVRFADGTISSWGAREVEVA